MSFLDNLKAGIDAQHPERAMEKVIKQREENERAQWQHGSEFAGNYSEAERKQGAKEGWALPDGSFPIKNAQDVGDAIGLAGNYKGPYNAKAHIKKRAAAVGASDKIPDSWK